MDKYIGKRLDGRYEIKEIIGVGGMAYVYKAHDCIDDRTVAVKILKDEYLANEEFTRRFRNESKAIAILSHPNIVKVLDVSFGERLQYIVMEYIDGITLKEYIEQKQVTWKEAVHFTVQILRALQHAHDKGIVHRDIKPQNIMLLSDGTIKVTDFGIARFSRNAVRTGLGDKAIGSVHYISPEQARGGMTDEKSDIYSVGVMLYEMLTGRLPFEADNAVSVAIMQLQSQPKKPSEINPDIPEGLEEITLKAMQKDPEKRYQSAAEMLYDIDEFKRNPSIHFEYKYFVDDTPTRFVETITHMKAESHPEEEEEEDEEKEKSGPRTLPILAAVTAAFVLVALVFVGFILLTKVGNADNNEIPVPNLVGRMYNEVSSEELQDFIGRIELNYENNELPAGTVIKQDPIGDKMIKAGTKTLTLTISLGPKEVEIPQVSATDSEEKVVSLLRAKGFATNVVPISSNSVAAGYVVKTSPAYPEKAPEGSTVNVYVSTGSEPVPDVPVPNIVGAAQADAVAKLTEQGFVVKQENIVTVNHPEYGTGVVISQSPDSGEAQPGTEIILTVSSGYRDITDITIPLPNTDQTIDLRVFVDGRLLSTGAQYTTDLQNILPSVVRFVVLDFTEQKESYTVTIQMAAAGSNNYKNYIEFSMDGIQGTATEIARYPFSVGGTTTTTSVWPTMPRYDDD